LSTTLTKTPDLSPEENSNGYCSKVHISTFRINKESAGGQKDRAKDVRPKAPTARYPKDKIWRKLNDDEDDPEDDDEDDEENDKEDDKEDKHEVDVGERCHRLKDDRSTFLDSQFEMSLTGEVDEEEVDASEAIGLREQLYEFYPEQKYHNTENRYGSIYLPQGVLWDRGQKRRPMAR
ncbi:hypothetical protein LTR46_011686, partial [Exophiala xenobiotica]